MLKKQKFFEAFWGTRWGWVTLILMAWYLALVTLPGAGAAEDMLKGDLFSPLQIQIKVSKKMFRINEPVSGTVIIKNTYPATLLAIFRIKLFHDGREFSERITSIATVYSGTTKFSFKNFGILEFNNGAGSEGEWRIRIAQQSRDSSAAEVTLRVVPPQ